VTLHMRRPKFATACICAEARLAIPCTAKEEVKEKWDYASWKAIPAVKRYAHPRYKAEGPPRPIFRCWLDDLVEVLPMMQHVREVQAMA